MGLLKNRTKYKKLKQKYIDNEKSNFHFNRSFKSPHFKLFYNGKYIYFKTQPNIDLCYNELLCNAIATLLNIDCVRYTPAILKHNGVKYKGLISESFVKDNNVFLESANFLTGCNSGLIGIMQNLNNVKKKSSFYFNDNQIELALFKILVFDFLTCQSDRHDCNFGFILTKYNYIPSSIKVAPVFDNEQSFGYTNKGKVENIEDIVNIIPRFTPFSYSNYNLNSYLNGEAQDIAKELISYAKYKPMLMEYIKHTLKYFNVNDIEKELHKQKIAIPKQKLLKIMQIVNLKKKCLLNEYTSIYGSAKDIANLDKENRTEFTK